jgi:hypothetical protein
MSIKKLRSVAKTEARKAVTGTKKLCMALKKCALVVRLTLT